MSKKDNKKETLEKEQVEAVDTQTMETEEKNAESTQPEISVEDALKEEIQEEKNKFLRLFAEFENYKKRTSRERIELFATASEDVMKNLLPVVDDFERALTHMEKDDSAEELKKGVDLIYQKLINTLGQKGLKPIQVEKGDVFNADDHEAITQIPAPTDDMKGKIIDIVEKGYKLGDKVIRFPKVVIGQ